MDDDDDYFGDDFVLDDTTAAALDSLEQSFQPQLAPPPPKRRKTINNSFDYDDLPDITVGSDGSYAVARPVVARNPPPAPPRQPVNKPAAQPPRKPVPAPAPVLRAVPAPRSVPNTAVLAASDAELDELRKKVEELSKQNERYKAEAAAANSANWTSKGQVSILQANMNKATLEHSQQIEKLKKAKEESEAKQIAIQKEMTAEMERLKAARRFQDLDNASRKIPVSARSKRISKDVPSTPLVAATPMRGWNQGHRLETPVRGGQANPFSPEKTHKKRLMGFQNAFAETPARPLRSPRHVEAPKLEPAVIEPIPFPQPFEDALPPMDSSTPPEAVTEIASAVDDLNLPWGEPIDWKGELTRLTLMHTSLTNAIPTIRLLSGLEMAPEHAESYSDSTTRLLDVIASTKDYDLCVAGVCACLVSMSTAIIASQQFDALAALFDLLSTLSRYLPTFSAVLLNHSEDELDLVRVLRPLIREQLSAAKCHAHQVLAHDFFGLLEEICWNLKDDAYIRFSMFCDSDPLMVLLDTSHPSWLLCRSTSLLFQAATHSKLAQKLTTPEVGPSGKETLPHIDRLSVLLVDHGRTDDDGMQMKRNIITYFGALAVSQPRPDIHTALLSSPNVFPALAALCSRLTTPFWEDAEAFCIPEETINQSIHLLGQAVLLFHYLVFGSESDANLRQRLQNAPARPFSGVNHVFLVTFGRLSCGDPPDWMTESQKHELESLGDLAQDLVDQVVDGPEMDSIWQAFQGEPNDAMNVDDAVALEANLHNNG
uniref:DNA repair protein Rad26 n=1 Tax=Mycena chlorophos TaxID=658473 RepID=A0ABQ0M0C1_MYCCL|nr:predicted protein [Mycena chlorophos]